jgi:hypothetical protein
MLNHEGLNTANLSTQGETASNIQIIPGGGGEEEMPGRRI